MPKTIQTMTMAGLVALAPLMFCSAVRADELIYEFAEPYLQRIEGLTASAGNAKDVNAVTHMVDPWPRYVNQRRIPANGQRMTGAVDRYRQGRLQFAPPPIAPIYSTNQLSGGSGGSGAAPAAGAQQ
jgi:hypothetical protein